MRLTDRDTVAKDAPLIESVKRHGILSPVLAYRDGENVVIYAGQRRFHAAAITGHPLPALGARAGTRGPGPAFPKACAFG